MKNQYSIVRRISIQMTLILVILLTTLILSNIYSLEVVHRNAVANSRDNLSTYINNIQNNLNNSSLDLLEVFDNHINPFLNYGDMNENQKYFALIDLKQKLTSKVSTQRGVDALFMTILDEDMLLASASNRVYSREGLHLSDYLRTYEFPERKEEGTAEWVSFELSGRFYLLKSLRYSNVVFGAIVKADTLLSSYMLGSSNDQNLFFLSDRSGQVLSATSPVGLQVAAEGTSNSDYIYISERVEEFGHITNIVERSNVFLGLETIQWIIIVLSITAIIVTPIILRSFAKGLIRPILELGKGAKEVEIGNWDYQFSPNNVSMEFARLFHSFNSMLSEIKSLKIRSYEEKLELNKAELKYLQMQLRPHFFLNAISTVSSLTFHNKNEEIRQLISLLSQHLRYMFRGGLVQVEIQEELQHVDNYIRMQELRYPNQIFYMNDVESDLHHRRLPQYLIQTFVENAFKHALPLSEMLSIFIKVNHISRNREDFVQVIIEDNGDGFPAEVLERNNAAGFGEQGTGEHQGILNIQKTLKLLYQRDDLLELSNLQPFGARVKILIPIEETHSIERR